MAVWESAVPRRVRSVSRAIRWPGNLGIVALDTLAVRLVFPVAAVGLALSSTARSWGLLNEVCLPGWFTVLLSDSDVLDDRGQTLTCMLIVVAIPKFQFLWTG